MDARQSLVAAIRRELAQRNVSVRAASRLSGVPIRSLHGLLQGDNVPSINRTKELCDGLGLEFYVGPPRAEETREGVEDRERRLIHDLRAVCEKVLERLDTLSRDRSADLHSGRLVANQVSDEGGLGLVGAW